VGGETAFLGGKGGCVAGTFGGGTGGGLMFDTCAE
jgi:hypothetical protein